MVLGPLDRDGGGSPSNPCSPSPSSRDTAASTLVRGRPPEVVESLVVTLRVARLLHLAPGTEVAGPSIGGTDLPGHRGKFAAPACRFPAIRALPAFESSRAPSSITGSAFMPRNLRAPTPFHAAASPRFPASLLGSMGQAPGPIRADPCPACDSSSVMGQLTLCFSRVALRLARDDPGARTDMTTTIGGASAVQPPIYGGPWPARSSWIEDPHGIRVTQS